MPAALCVLVTMFSSDLTYVRAYKNRMEWTNFSTGIEGDFSANFSSDNLKLHDFDLAEDELKESLKQLGLKN